MKIQASKQLRACVLTKWVHNIIPKEWLIMNCVINACSKQVSIKILHFKNKKL